MGEVLNGLEEFEGNRKLGSQPAPSAFIIRMRLSSIALLSISSSMMLIRQSAPFGLRTSLGLGGTFVSPRPSQVRLFSSPSPTPPIRGVIFDMDGTLTPPGLIDFNLLRTSIRSIASSDPANANGKLNLDEDALVLARQLSGEGRARCSEVLKEVEEKCLVDLRLVDGVKEVMEHCAENHVRAAVVTRNVERTMFRLKALIGDRKREDGTFVLDPMIARDTVKNDGEVERRQRA